MRASARRSPKAAATTAPGLVPYAALLRALGDETRLRIVDLLVPGPLCVCALYTALEMPQPTVSHHLRILRDAGVLDAERRGTWTYYGLRPEVVARLASLVAELAQPRARPINPRMSMECR